jgi:flagellar hook-associated protein 1 FlgK
MSMMGLGFTIAANSLGVIQTRINTTSNNIANANTKGYHREVVKVEDASWARSEGGNIKAGGGVELTSVTKVMDMFLAQRIQTASSNYAESSTQKQALTISEEVLAEQSSQVADAVQQFAASIGEVSKDASSPAAREKMIGTGANLATRLNDVVDGLGGTLSTLKNQQSAAITEANALAKALASTNNGIAFTGGKESYALKDRALLQARELADKVGGTFKVEDSGAFSFFLPNGKKLVDAEKVNPMDDADAASAGGAMSGRRSAINKVGDYLGSFNTLMKDVTNAFNTMHKQGTDLNNNPGQDFFSIGNDGKMSVLISDHKLVAAGKGAGKLDNSNALEMEKFSSMKVSAGGTLTFKEGYTAIQTNIGTYTGMVETDAGSDQDTLKGLEDFQKETEGVDLEKEGVDLMQARRHYEAMSQVIKTADSMMQTLLSIKA